MCVCVKGGTKKRGGRNEEEGGGTKERGEAEKGGAGRGKRKKDSIRF